MTNESETEHFHDGGLYHIETSPLICCANQLTGFYTITETCQLICRTSH